MSHSPERKEKDCLNCGTIVQGKYCHVCGQENLEPKESFFGMVSHFFNDITHFDGKFFSSIRDLLFRPGFLSREYVRGKRASYLHPVRMYVFTSALFFLVFFSSRDARIGEVDNEPYTPAKRERSAKNVKEALKYEPNDSNLIKQLELLEDSTKELRPSDLVPYQGEFVVISPIGGDYKTIREYDSIQAALPAGEKDGWFKHRWNKKAVALNEQQNKNQKVSNGYILNSILHKLPYLLFVSLPLFALTLKLLYRRRKEFYYIDHCIFSIHYYILVFILTLAVYLWDWLTGISGWGLWGWLSTGCSIAIFAYLYAGMKRFYGQGYFKTFLKFLLINFFALLILSILFILFSLFSIFTL
jgi:uncharacterized protein DUF3667